MRTAANAIFEQRNRARPFMVSAAALAVGLSIAAAPASAYDVIAVTNGGTIDGVVSLSGTPPAEAPITVTKNQDFCGSTIPEPVYLVDATGGLANVIVYLKDITKGKAGPTEPVILNNTHCMFVPRVLGAMVGQMIKVTTEDPILHNTHLQDAASNATIFNVAMPFKGFSVTKPLPASPEMINVKCDAHEWMHAWIMESDNPYFATTGADGHFTIKDVPPGSYTLVVWHEAGLEKSTPVTIAAGQTAKPKIVLASK